MKIQEAVHKRSNAPIRVLQYGEGNFLRAFVDQMIDIANEKGMFDGRVAIVKPIRYGSLDRFDKQDNLYTVVLRGKENGEVVDSSRIITSVAEVIDAEEEYDRYMALAELETLRFVVSNPTEAGIVLDENDHFNGLPETYPGKLTKFLYARYNAFGGDADRGLILLPVELIENNGGKLKECVLALAAVWQLPQTFIDWVNETCIFCSTLVDRIVTGYPKEAAAICEKLGYEDELLDVGEPFALWVIESKQDIRNELPLDKAGLPIIFTDDQRPYRERKVRILNGAHTSTVLAAFLAGKDIVRECMEDPIIAGFMRKVVFNEVIPALPAGATDSEAFAAAVFERFANPFIDHKLLSISLNSVSKWKARCLGSFKDSLAKTGKLPQGLTFSFAALIAFYLGGEINGHEAYPLQDDQAVLTFFENVRKAHNSAENTVLTVAKNADFWGEDLSQIDGFVETVAGYLESILTDGAYKAMEKVQ